MKKALMKAVTTSISEVLETMFYLPVEIGPEINFEEAGIEKSKSIACQLTFTGDVSGLLAIVSQEELTEEMAVNFLGESRDKLEPEHLSGTLTEMLNMACGNALSKIKPKVPYKLGIPELVSFSELNVNTTCVLIKTINSRMTVLLDIK